ncbi:YitT family protein [Romboutsia sp. CE17]|uniref:YczE/YyaS/YitT family protein n=1 Tax=Romboutsia sp. CE17 TaxID=2724150 RepID=UPI001442C987|nr:DUF6198 family protein [Romboutsia sp. CE17]QJA08849.1 YitT family protein [Romboutsia sp. CE17]
MKNHLQRYFWFIIGIIINSFGIALITKAGLGTSPISSISYVLSMKFPFTLGQFTFIVNMFFILAQFILLKKDFEPIQFLQIVVNVVFSACIDISMNLLSWLTVNNFMVGLFALLIGCGVLALGISIEVAPDVLVVPGEGIVRAISIVLNKRFGTVKVIFDITLVSTATILSFLFFGKLSGLGLGTIISAIIVGYIVNLLNQKFLLISYIKTLVNQEDDYQSNENLTI